MHNISHIVFPFLELYSSPDEMLWTNPIFRRIWKEIDLDEVPQHELEKHADEINVNTKALCLRQRPTPENLSSWPLFAIKEEDYKEFYNSNFDNMLSILELNWQICWNRCRPEVITQNLLKAVQQEYMKNVSEFNTWLEKKIQSNEEYYGVQLFPSTGITTAYIIRTEDMMASAVSLENRYIRYFHVNYQGIADSKVKKDVARAAERHAKNHIKIGRDDFFLEQIIEILNMEFYKEKYHLQPRTLKRGDTNNTQSEPIRIQTDIPLIAYNGFNTGN